MYSDLSNGASAFALTHNMYMCTHKSTWMLKKSESSGLRRGSQKYFGMNKAKFRVVGTKTIPFWWSKHVYLKLPWKRKEVSHSFSNKQEQKWSYECGFFPTCIWTDNKAAHGSSFTRHTHNSVAFYSAAFAGTWGLLAPGLSTYPKKLSRWVSLKPTFFFLSLMTFFFWLLLRKKSWKLIKQQTNKNNSFSP